MAISKDTINRRCGGRRRLTGGDRTLPNGDLQLHECPEYRLIEWLAASAVWYVWSLK